MSQALKPYSSYKTAKMPWLDQIPSHWDEKRAKYFFREVDERSQTGEEELLSVSHKTGITPRSEKNVTMFKAESYVGSKLCKPGDIVINTMWAWMAALGVSNHAGIVSPAYGVYRPLEEGAYSRLFLDNLLRTRSFVSEYICRSTGIRSSRLRLYPDQFLRIPFVYPPKEEQGIIEKYLRAKTTQIAKFIKAKRKLIALLNEQKQAIINQAVTRGLDANVRLKPSGVDYLGDIPEHWEVRRLKYLVNNVNNQTATKAPDEKYIALEHVESWTGAICYPDGDISFESLVKQFTPDDVLFGKLRPYLAKVAFPKCRGVCVGEFLVFRCHDEKLIPCFLENKLRSFSIIDLVNSSTYGAKMPRADWTFIGNLFFSYPDKSEQQQIVDGIKEKTSKLNAAIASLQNEIDLIREYRTRLISDVVTGKLDVRGIEVEEVDASEVLGDHDEAEENTFTEEAEEDLSDHD